MQKKHGMILMTCFLFIAVILFATFGLNPVKIQSTSIMAIIPSTSNTHNIVFQVCAEDTIMRDPEVKITSDIENKKIKLSKEILPNSCRQTSAQIQASNITSIKLEKIDKSQINQKINLVDEKILQIRSEIFEKNSEIENLVTQISEGSSIESKTKQRINALTNELSLLRQELKIEMNELEQLRNQLKNYSGN